MKSTYFEEITVLTFSLRRQKDLKERHGAGTGEGEMPVLEKFLFSGLNLTDQKSVLFPTEVRIRMPRKAQKARQTCSSNFSEQSCALL